MNQLLPTSATVATSSPLTATVAHSSPQPPVCFPRSRKTVALLKKSYRRPAKAAQETCGENMYIYIDTFTQYSYQIFKIRMDSKYL